MSRDEMIAVLISDTVERMVVLRQVFWLQEILENGFAGYAQWSDAQLRGELNGRGIGLDDSLRESVDADADEFEDADDGDEFLDLGGHLGEESRIGY